MGRDELTNAVKDTVGAMSNRDPFLAFLLIVMVGLLCACIWFNRLNERALYELNLRTLREFQNNSSQMNDLREFSKDFVLTIKELKLLIEQAVDDKCT